MTPADELQALDYAIARLETELQRTLSQERRDAINLTVQTLREMRANLSTQVGRGCGGALN